MKTRRDMFDSDVRFMDETVFVYGLYHPEHYAHMLFNGLLALYRSVKHYNGTNNSWTYRPHATAISTDRPPLITTEFITRGKDIVADKRNIVTDQQVIVPHAPICFSRAVVGTGAACSLQYCQQPIESSTYASFRKDALSYYVDDGKFENVTNHSAEKDLACVHSMRVMNTLHSNITTRRTIAIINRRSRYITNIQQLIDSLATSSRISNSNYVIKEIDFDHGCSLASTAYLLHDVDILVTPHGSQEGAAVFMKDNSVVVSIDGRGYSEPWFAFVMTAMGRRFYNFQAQTDLPYAKYILDLHGISLPSDNEIEQCISWTDNIYAIDCMKEKLKAMNAYKDDDYSTLAIAMSYYMKDAPRKVDLSRFIPFIEQVVQEMDEFEREGTSYREICDLHKCCGFDCRYPLEVTVYGSQLDGRLQAWEGESGQWKGGDWQE
ncbi:hypothetical protein DFQ29_002997 [Apophysomyces sp. BC1021]|nr:hypothetical protein DFQ29_002997 [Apophysomyces sp. BC1021]